jgi:hypothetical protein
MVSERSGPRKDFGARRRQADSVFFGVHIEAQGEGHAAICHSSPQCGTLCIYEATSPAAIREHALRVGMPADEITPVAATVIVRADPMQQAAAA